MMLTFLLAVMIWRVTRLLVQDQFPPVRAIREWFIRTWGVVDPDGAITGGRRLGGIGYAVAYLWTCPWCMSVWVAAGTVAVADWRLSVPLPWLVAGLGAGLSGVLAWVEVEHDQRWRLRQLHIDKLEGQR